MGKDRFGVPSSRGSLLKPSSETHGAARRAAGIARKNLYGRGSPRALRPRERALLKELLPTLSVPGPLEAGALDPFSLFPSSVRSVSLEIGFGAGERFLEAARARPQTGFIGCEFYRKGIARTLSAFAAAPMANIRLYEGAGEEILDSLRDASLSEIAVLFPDPWPKRRHRRRRFSQAASLRSAARALADGGLLWIATDSPIFSAWTLMQAERVGSLFWTAARAEDWRRSPYPGVQTRYGRKAARGGRGVTHLLFRRAARADFL